MEKTLDTLDLTDASWNLLIHSYGPGEDENDPSVSKITDVDFGEQKLGKWKDIAATEDQLNELGVTDMLYVSGDNLSQAESLAQANPEAHPAYFSLLKQALYASYKTCKNQ